MSDLTTDQRIAMRSAVRDFIFSQEALKQAEEVHQKARATLSNLDTHLDEFCIDVEYKTYLVTLTPTSFSVRPIESI